MAKIILAGGSGFIGQILDKHFTDRGDEVVVLTRGKEKTSGKTQWVRWDARTTGAWAGHLENARLLINLTGKSVNCRYNEKNRKEILRSRLDATRALGEALKTVQRPPGLWINASSATIYRHAEDRPQDEYSGETGNGFSVDVCRQWENCFFEQDTPGTRKIALRITIALSSRGGALPYYLNLVKYGLGGRQGNGKQYFSWIHESDLTGIVDFLAARPELDGIFNVSSPNPVPNREFMRTLREALSRPFGLPASRWMLEIGTFLLGTETELILKSRWVLPKRLQEAGYRFKAPTLGQAVTACLNKS